MQAPLEEYIAAAEKYEALKDKVASQEETIKHLNLYIASFNPAPEEFTPALPANVHP